MGGMYVFPGGMVDEFDRHMARRPSNVDLGLSEIEKRLGDGLDAEDALAFGIAAIRETFEEAGVLLAHPDGEDGLIQANQQRDMAEHQPGWFKTMVLEQHWCLELSRLSRWAHWITPKAMKRHFDTRFFVAAMPDGQTCRPDARETTEGVWTKPLNGLKENAECHVGLSPPTLVTLHALSKFQSFDALCEDLSMRPWGETIHPRMIPLEKGAVILEPWDPAYGQAKIGINPDTLEEKRLPVGEDFSRVWLRDGFWHPVAV